MPLRIPRPPSLFFYDWPQLAGGGPLAVEGEPHAVKLVSFMSDKEEVAAGTMMGGSRAAAVPQHDGRVARRADLVAAASGVHFVVEWGVPAHSTRPLTWAAVPLAGLAVEGPAKQAHLHALLCLCATAGRMQRLQFATRSAPRIYV